MGIKLKTHSTQKSGTLYALCDLKILRQDVCDQWEILKISRHAAEASIPLLKTIGRMTFTTADILKLEVIARVGREDWGR